MRFTMICDDISEVKIVVRCVLVASIEAITIEELWKKVEMVFGGPQRIQLTMFGYDRVFDFLKSIPDVVQLEDPEDENSIVNLVSSKLSRHMEQLVSSNIIRPPSLKNKMLNKDLLVPYRIQCAFIRIFVELYPKGLTVSDFVSDVLCFPIFKSYVDCVEVLLYNLDHIFKKCGLETISLHPAILNNLKEVKSGQFTAIDICNIDECSLVSSNADQRIANGLEYPLFNILEEPIKNNIELLLNEEPGSITETNICNLYISKFGSSFTHYRRWGFNRVSQMFSKLPELCCVHFSENGVEIISAKKHTCDVYKKKGLEENIKDSKLLPTFVKDKIENTPNAGDGVLVQFLRNDGFLEASLDDCFLDQSIKNVELSIGNSYNVHVCRVNSNITPSLICQKLDKSSEHEKLIVDMKRFYFIHESEFAFDPTITMVKHTYAFFLNDFWFRGIVTNVSLNAIKIIDIDNGSMHTIQYEDIRILHKQFSQLPAQAFTCHLHGIEFVDEDELSKIVNNKCTVYVVAVDQHTQSVSVKIRFLNSASDYYLNDEWLKNGIAAPDSSSDEE